MSTQSLLNEGMIPANTECPFLHMHCKSRCIVGHKGIDHSVSFSCAMARAWDLSTSLSHKKLENKNEQRSSV
jgi:hypothetical protein